MLILRALKAGKGSVRRRHRPRRIRSKWLALLLLGAASAITWQFARQQPSFYSTRLSSEIPAARFPGNQGDSFGRTDPQSDSKPLAFGTNRLVYPYSVIRGGVLSPDELKRATELDPVVSRHFQGFDYGRAHLVQLSENRSMYVSYRIGEKVYWTRRKVSLHSGETLITDGRIVARTRCGNRVAQVPLDAGSPLEPSREELEQPITRMDPNPTMPTLATPTPAKLPDAIPPVAKSDTWWFIPPPVYIPEGSSSQPLAVTPEPGTTLMVSSGLAAVYWRIRRSRRNK